MEPSTAFVALDHERAGMVALLTDAIQSRVIGIPAFPLVLRSHRSWRDTRKHWKLLIKRPFSGTRRRRSTRRSCRRSCRRRRRTTRTNNKATPTEMRHLDPRSPRVHRCLRPMLPLVTRSIACPGPAAGPGLHMSRSTRVIDRSQSFVVEHFLFPSFFDYVDLKFVYVRKSGRSEALTWTFLIVE